jgi:SAM-dependent methyltransferase
MMASFELGGSTLARRGFDVRKRRERARALAYSPIVTDAREAPGGDYVLGTGDAEVERLGLQHRVWQPHVLDCWRRAGIGPGSRVVDVGAGPGWASFDLAEIVGPTGSVIAVERSSRFLAAIEAGRASRGLGNLAAFAVDLMTDPLPGGPFDVAWCRWVASFVSDPGLLVRRIADGLRPGGVAVFHEYAGYATWRWLPREPRVERLVEHVMRSWREAGGEPDVGLELPSLAAAAGFVVRETTPLVVCAGPGDPVWQWLAAFAEVSLGRMVERGDATAEWADGVRAAFRDAERGAGVLTLSPMVLEIVAVKEGPPPRLIQRNRGPGLESGGPDERASVSERESRVSGRA